MDAYSEGVNLDAERTSEEDTLDAVSKVGEETQIDHWSEDESMKGIEEGHNLTTGQ